ncbi:response regulator [Mangrovibacterium sp.]|uniref:response regulator n=1 Tax=Mangrovibacterium sp. TaxID=1961364 RepID=UPI003566AAF6
MKILVVDDNPINQKFVQYSLRNAHIVDTANDGEEAVMKASANTYDLIIMDLSMPIMDGAEATLRIRQLECEPNRQTPIVVFTTSNMENDRERCMKYGANDYLIKPIRAAKLMEQVALYSGQ